MHRSSSRNFTPAQRSSSGLSLGPHPQILFSQQIDSHRFNLLQICFKIEEITTFVATHCLITDRSGVGQDLLVKATQAIHFSSELKVLSSNSTLPSSHVFNRLTAFIDEQGVIRVGGRLKLSHLGYASKHPAILPRHSRLSDLVIDHAHRLTLDGGTQLTLAHIRYNYWIIGGRATVKSHILRCVVCTRQRGSVSIN